MQAVKSASVPINCGPVTLTALPQRFIFLLQASSDNEDLSRTEAEELAKRMMSTADLDGNGLIDFEEYCAVVERAGPGD